ncbi:MAG: hypothetical protein ABMA64_19125 [Myxococcota bacterium]
MWLVLSACTDPSTTATTGDTASPTTEPFGCTFPGAFTPVPDSRAVALDGGPLHPWGLLADPFVQKDGDRYRMWLTTVDWLGQGEPPWSGAERVMGTGYLESADGIRWDDQWIAPTSPDRQASLVLAPGAWDTLGVETVTVAAPSDGPLVLLHTGDLPSGGESGADHAIGLATSDDGLVWQRAAAPVLVPERDWETPICVDEACTSLLGGVLEPTVVVDPTTGDLRLWYAAWGVADGLFGTRMGAATSRDGGLTWDRHPDPVFAPGAPGEWDDAIVSHFHVVADPTEGFHLFYYGMALEDAYACEDLGCAFTPGWIGHAFSEDGLSWQRNPANPVLRADTAGYERWFLGGPTVSFEGDTLRMWVFTADTRQDADEFRLAIEMATATCP